MGWKMRRQWLKRTCKTFNHAIGEHMKLSKPQIQTYHTDDISSSARCWQKTEADRMAQVYLDCLENFRGARDSQGIRSIRQDGENKDNPARNFQLRCAHLMHPDFKAIVRDDRLLDAVESLIGPNIRIVICQGLYKPPHTGNRMAPGRLLFSGRQT